MLEQFHHIKMFPLILLSLISLLSGCGSEEVFSVEEQIRQYLYHNQPLQGKEFVVWANKELNGYSNREIYTALKNVGQSQAELGHPNAVAALSYAAQAWAEAKNLRYKPDEWHAIQQVAIENLQNGNQGALKLWP